MSIHSFRMFLEVKCNQMGEIICYQRCRKGMNSNWGCRHESHPSCSSSSVVPGDCFGRRPRDPGAAGPEGAVTATEPILPLPLSPSLPSSRASHPCPSAVVSGSGGACCPDTHAPHPPLLSPLPPPWPGNSPTWWTYSLSWSHPT